MKARLRRVGQIVAALLLVMGAAVTLALWHGGEMLRAALQARLQERLVPTLRLAAPLEWQLHPQPQVIVRDVTLTEASGATVLALDELRLTLDGAGLAQGSVDITSVDVDGLDLTLERDVDGGWRAVGWLRAAPPDAAPATTVPVGRLRVGNTRVRIGGEQPLDIAGIELQVAPLRPGARGEFSVAARVGAPTAGVAELRVNAVGLVSVERDRAVLEQLKLDGSGEIGAWSVSRVEVRSQRLELRADAVASRADDLTADLAARTDAARVEAQIVLATLSGSGADWRGEALDARLRGEQAGRGASVSLRADEVHVHPNGWALPALTLQAASTGTAPSASLSLQGAARFDATAGASQLALTVREALGSVPHPADAAATLELTWSGSVRYDPASGSAGGALSGSFDRSRFDGRWAYDPLAPTPVEVSASLDKLDLDRYLPPADVDAGGGPPDLAMWRDWPVRADLRVGELRVRGLVSRQARLRLGDGATDGR